MSAEHAHDQDRRARARRGRGRDARPHPRRRASSDVQLRIYEPPRFFEAFLRGRGYTEPPDITARICGICPVAYQMSAVRGDRGRVRRRRSPSRSRDLRRLLYCGEWIESHALHVYMLHAPDFLGYDERDRDGRATTAASSSAGCRSRRPATRSCASSAAATIHPVNVRVGGFYRAPDARASCAPLRRAAASARASSRSRPCAGPAGSTFPDFEPRPRARRAARRRTTTRSSAGGSSPAAASTSPPREYEEHFVEEHVRALHRAALAAARARRATSPGRSPATRSTRDRLSPLAREAAADGRARRRLPQPVPQHRRPRASRCSTRSTRRCGSSTRTSRPTAPAVEVAPRAGVGLRLRPRRRAACSTTATSSTTTGTILDARIVPPTSQNQARDRGRPARASSPRHARPRRRRAAATAASRRSATTTRASPARRTSCTLEVERVLTARHRRRQRAARRRRRRPRGRPRVARARPARRRARGRGRRRSRCSTRWAGADEVVVVDAVRSGAPPGTRAPLRRAGEPLPPALRGASTHAFGLAEAIELARALGRLPGAARRLRHRGRALRHRGAAVAARRGAPSRRSRGEPLRENRSALTE